MVCLFACLQELANQTEMLYKNQAHKRRMRRLKRIIYDDGEKGLAHQTHTESIEAQPWCS